MWSDDRNAISYSVYGQLVNADGTLNGDTLLISGAGAVDKWMPSVAFDGTNQRFLVVWYDFRNPCAEPLGWCANADIYGQLVNASGTLSAGDFIISPGSGESPIYNPSVAYSAAAQQFLVAWYGHNAEYDIYGNLVAAGGSPSESDIAIATAEGGQYLPSVAYNSRCGNFMVAHYTLESATTSYAVVGPPCPPDINASPATKNFGTVAIGSSSSAQTFTIAENGGGSLEIGAVALAGASASLFAIQNDTCSNQTIAPAGTCTIEVTFSPASAGAKSAVLSIPSNDGDTPIIAALLSGTGAVPLSLQPPRALTARAMSASSIVLEWDDRASSETGYKLQRKNGGCASTASWSEIATPGADETAYTDSGLTPNTAYSYRIRAYNGTAHSSYSICASARTGRTGSPDSPTDLAAISLSNSTVTLVWTDVSDDETSFKIYRKLGANPWRVIATVAADTETYDATATGNTASIAYSFYVEACNSSGCSPASSQAKVPFSPSNVTATASAGKVDLLWRDRSSNENSFHLYRKDGLCADPGTWNLLSTPAANTRVYSDTGLAGAASYSYRVRAYTESPSSPHAWGYSSWSNCAQGTVP